MPRKLRVEYPGALYHVMSRGDRREDIFLDDVDQQDFIKTLDEACQKTDWQVHASLHQRDRPACPFGHLQKCECQTASVDEATPVNWSTPQPTGNMNEKRTKLWVDPFTALTLSHYFLWGLDLSGSLQGAGGIGGLLALSSPTSAEFTCYDANGNIAALVDASSGTVVGQYEYGPFGEVIRATGPVAKLNPFRWSTQYQDDETDLVCYLHRYYSPSTGRWLSQDPVGEPGFRLLVNPSTSYDSGPNLYGFVGNSPISFVDELGLGYGNPVSGPNGPVGPAYPYDPNPWNPPPPPPPSCSSACVSKYIFGIEVDTTIIVSGMPTQSKRFVMVNSSEGTSIAGKMTDAILGNLKVPGQPNSWYAPTWKCLCKGTIGKSPVVSRVISRWIPVVGLAILTYDASGLAGCLCGCNGI